MLDTTATWICLAVMAACVYRVIGLLGGFDYPAKKNRNGR